MYYVLTMVITAASPVQWVNFGSWCVGTVHRLADLSYGKKSKSNRLLITVPVLQFAFLIIPWLCCQRTVYCSVQMMYDTTFVMLLNA